MATYCNSIAWDQKIQLFRTDIQEKQTYQNE